MHDKLTLNISGKQFEITPEQEEQILNILAKPITEDEIVIEIEETTGIKIKREEEETHVEDEKRETE